MTDDSIAHAVDRVTMHFDIIMPIEIFVGSSIAVHFTGNILNFIAGLFYRIMQPYHDRLVAADLFFFKTVWII